MNQLPGSMTLVFSFLHNFELPDSFDIRTRPAIMSADRVHFTPGSSGNSILGTFVGNTRMLHMFTQRAPPGDHLKVHTRQIADMFSVPHAVTSLSIGTCQIAVDLIVTLLSSFPSLTHLKFHEETDDRSTWAPYEVRETREYCIYIAKCLKTKIPPLSPPQDLCMYIEVTTASLTDTNWIRDITSELEPAIGAWLWDTRRTYECASELYPDRSQGRS
ncbi:hypothetical protein C8Q74DRAFT_377752 [Fomes fomentarius]|nr:hypothetical protein C8Q74DRAFT_377752 [Fomes fomentarius]